jgi:hypothetical protein
LFVAGTPANLHCADKVGSPGFEKLKNVALVSIHDPIFANNAARVEKFTLRLTGNPFSNSRRLIPGGVLI